MRLIQCVVTKGGPNALAHHPIHINAAIGAGNSTNGMKINGWKGYEEVLRLLPGKSFDEIQKIDDGAMKSKSTCVRGMCELAFDNDEFSVYYQILISFMISHYRFRVAW